MTITIFMFVSRRTGTNSRISKITTKTSTCRWFSRPSGKKGLADIPAITYNAILWPKETPMCLHHCSSLETADTVDYDCITTVEFDDDAHFKRFNEVFRNSPMKREIEVD